MSYFRKIIDITCMKNFVLRRISNKRNILTVMLDYIAYQNK